MDFAPDSFEITYPLAGDLLISEPFLPDPNFERSVILLCQHDQNGSFGLVLNQKLELEMTDLFEDFPSHGIPTYMGGPVEKDTLHFIHSDKELPDAQKISEGIYWSGDFEELQFRIKSGFTNKDEIKFFAGYSGWGANQLIDEIERKSWIVLKEAKPTHVFYNETKDYWRKVLSDMGGKYKMMANFPTDPRLN